MWCKCRMILTGLVVRWDNLEGMPHLDFRLSSRYEEWLGRSVADRLLSGPRRMLLLIVLQMTRGRWRVESSLNSSFDWMGILCPSLLDDSTTQAPVTMIDGTNLTVRNAADGLNQIDYDTGQSACAMLLRLTYLVPSLPRETKAGTGSMRCRNCIWTRVRSPLAIDSGFCSCIQWKLAARTRVHLRVG